MLYRYTLDRAFGGDTWHETLEDALEQAIREYGEAVEEWHAIPLGVTDAIDYAIVRGRGLTGGEGATE
jgi:hypothetical protein